MDSALICPPKKAGIGHAGGMKPIRVIDYDASWPSQYGAERDGLRVLLGRPRG